MSAPVAITGFGAVGPFGVGEEALRRALAGAAPAPVEVAAPAGWRRRRGARTALLARDLDLAALLPANLARRMSPPARLAVAATRLALADAGLDAMDDEQLRRTAVALGTAFGPAWVTEELLGQIFGSGPESASPALFTESVASAAAAQIGLVFRTRGPSVAITEREASDLLALAEGARLVASGAADRALVVVVDEMVPLLHAVLDRFRALAQPEGDGVERARPFDRRRSGALAAEGATVLVLERADHAAARGVRARAIVRALARAFDPSAPAWGYGAGERELAALLGRGLERAAIAPGSLGRVLSGASGSPRGDRLEAAVLDRLFDGAPPPVGVVKGVLGGWGGGHLAAAVLLAEGTASLPGSPHREPDPDLGIRPATAAEWPSGGPLLVSSVGSGGAAAWAVLVGREPGTELAV